MLNTQKQNKFSLFALRIVVLLAGFGLASCDQQQNTGSEKLAVEKVQNESKPAVKTLSADEIAQKYIIIDTHIDVPHRLEENYEEVSQNTQTGDFDYPRAVMGGLDAPFMSIYIPATLQESGGSKALADKLIDMVEEIIRKSPEQFTSGNSTSEVESAFKKGLIALPLGMENGSAIEGKLENLQHFYNRGIRYITLTHSKANHISDSSYDENRPAGGLTEFGKQLIVEMNKLGVMVDVSHISDDAFFQVMAISQVPVIATHSSARHFTPGFERNMSDEMIKLLAEKGGVIHINFGSTFINQQSIENNNAYKAAIEEFMAQHQLEREHEAVVEFAKGYREKIPFHYASLADVLDHFDHVIKLVGVDHVGIGSDYDGVGDSLPVGLKDVSTYPALIQGLIDRGYKEEAIAKILSGNLLRVWKQNEAYAEKHRLKTVESVQK